MKYFVLAASFAEYLSYLSMKKIDWREARYASNVESMKGIDFRDVEVVRVAGWSRSNSACEIHRLLREMSL